MKVPATEKRPLILVTNDDGIEAKGVHELAKMIEDLGDIVVVAPDSPFQPIERTICRHSSKAQFDRTLQEHIFLPDKRHTGRLCKTFYESTVRPPA